MVVSDFNMSHISRSRDEGHIYTQKPALRMKSTKAELSFNKIIASS